MKTREEILKLDADRETDALIAIEVLGLNIKKVETWEGDLTALGGTGKVTFLGEFTIQREWVEAGDYVIVLDDEQYSIMPEYTKETSSAMELLNLFAWRASKDENEKYWIAVWNKDISGWKTRGADGQVFLQDSFELGVCRAVLLAIGTSA